MNLKQVVFFFLPRKLAARLEASPLAYRLARGTFWSVAGAVSARGLQLVAFIVVARVVGQEAFGELGVVLATIVLFCTLADAGQAATATKHIAQLRKSDPQRAERIMRLCRITGAVVSGVFCAILLTLAPFLAVKILASPNITDLLRVASLAVFFQALAIIVMGGLAGFEAFRVIARLNVIRGIAVFLLVVTGVALYGLVGAIWGLGLAWAIGWLTSEIALGRRTRTESPLAVSGWWREWPVLFRFSTPVFFSIVVFRIAEWLCIALLANQISGYREVALFAAATHWRSLIVFVPFQVAFVALPVLTDLRNQEDNSQYVQALKANVLACLVVAAALASIIAALSPIILASYGKDFVAGTWVLVLQALTGIFFAINGAFERALASVDKPWAIFAANVIRALGLALLAAVLVPQYKALGLALAFLIAHALYSASLITLVLRYAVKNNRLK